MAYIITEGIMGIDIKVKIGQKIDLDRDIDFI